MDSRQDYAWIPKEEASYEELFGEMEFFVTTSITAMGQR